MKHTLKALVGAFVLSQASFAIVHPAGTVLDDACGNLNKSQQLCLATAVGSDNQYFVIRHFMKGSTSIPVTSVRAGLGWTVLKGNGIGEKATSETVYSMTLRTDAKGSFAVWSVDGKARGPEIQMEPMAHPR